MSAVAPKAPRSTLVGQTIEGHRIWLTERNPWTPRAWYQGPFCYVVGGGRIVLERVQVARYLTATKRYESTRNRPVWSHAY